MATTAELIANVEKILHDVNVYAAVPVLNTHQWASLRTNLKTLSHNVGDLKAALAATPRAALVAAPTKETHMPSSNADSPNVDAAAYEAQHGVAPQVSVNREAVGYATLAALTNDPNRWDGSPEIENADKQRQAFAIQFSKGEIEWGAFRSYLGKSAQVLIDNGLVDGDAVKAALVAALG